MSSEASQKKIQPKPFLKKGTRQFLSNATVRSQAQKQKVIDFTHDQPQQYQPHSLKDMPSSKHESQIVIKTNSMRRVEKKEKPPLSKNRESLRNKQKIQDKRSEKKETLLSQYLDLEGSEDRMEIRTSIQKPKRADSTKKIIGNRQSCSSSKHTSLTNMLKRQDEEEDSIEIEKNGLQNNSSFRPIVNPLKREEKESGHKKVNNWEEDYNFESESSEENKDNEMENRRRQKNRNIQKKQNQSRNANKSQSKIAKKYFGKNSGPIESTVDTTSRNQIKLEDIPKQLKEKIINEAIGEKQGGLNKQLGKLKEKIEAANRSKAKFEEELRNLNKEREEFEKEKEERNKEFEERMKNESAKLLKEKKIMKEAQLAGKGDYRLKNEINELKKALEDSKEQKKKMETKLKTEIGRLKDKLAEETHTNKLLTEQVKILEYGNLVDKEKMKEIKDKTKEDKGIKINKGEWDGAPQNSYLFKMLEQNFSLNLLNFDEYDEEANQFYRYYESIKDEASEIVRESCESDIIKRVYRNGKRQQEYPQKYIKQIFPFGYTVVHFKTGDIKQILPHKLQIYYSHASNSTEYTINEHKKVYLLKDNGTIQMKNQIERGKEIHEIFNGKHLKRIMPNGQILYQKRNQEGKIHQWST